MDINKFILSLNSNTYQNESLNLLYQIVVDTNPALINSLIELIKSPASIENTNQFASLLEFFSETEFIPPLIEVIQKGTPFETPWLADYMYALGSVLMNQDECWEPEESFVHLLGKWLHSTKGGEICWKSAVILSQLNHPATRSYFISGAADSNIFHQARTACINGIVNHFKGEAIPLLEKHISDPEPEVSAEVARALEWLKSQT